jgi:hypothetical protein
MSPPAFMARYIDVLRDEVVPELQASECPGNTLPCDFCIGEKVGVSHLECSGTIISVDMDEKSVVLLLDTDTLPPSAVAVKRETLVETHGMNWSAINALDVGFVVGIVTVTASQVRSLVPLPPALINPRTGKIGSKEFLRNIFRHRRQCTLKKTYNNFVLSNEELIRIMPLHIRNRVLDEFISWMSVISYNCDAHYIDDDNEWVPYTSVMHTDVRFKPQCIPLMPTDMYCASSYMFCGPYDFITCLSRSELYRPEDEGHLLELRFPGDYCTVHGTTYAVPACTFRMVDKGARKKVIVVDFIDFNSDDSYGDAAYFEDASHRPHACAIFDDGSAAFTPWGVVLEPFLRAWGKHHRAFYDFIIHHSKTNGSMSCIGEMDDVAYAAIDRAVWSMPLRKQRALPRIHDVDMVSVIIRHTEYTETRPVSAKVVDASSVLSSKIVKMKDGTRYVDLAQDYLVAHPLPLPDDVALGSLTMWMIQGQDYVPYRLADVMNACAQLGMQRELEFLAYFIAPTYRLYARLRETM